ncbi:MAG: hypothetical protein HZC22_09960 [Rhodocyclales bacterium]|nr:hypothetical protein [Rhodocyclales bacterium]
MMEHVRISVSSPPDRERLVAEVFLDDIQWAEVNQESGDLEVEFYQRPDGKPWRIPFAAAIDALLRAKAELHG